MICIDILNQRELEILAEKLGQLVHSGDVICMTGDLGAGKTTFTQAFARGLGVEDYVTSPTFTLVQEYYGRIPLYHFDVYRITHVSEMYDIGYEEYFYGDGVCVIEWASLVEEVLPKDRLCIDITVTGEETRKLCLSFTNVNYEQMIEELLKI